MNTIKIKDLENMVSRLNDELNTPQNPWGEEGGKMVANVGCFHLSQAYGGVDLHQMSNTGGGVRDVFFSGHVTKRKLFASIRGMLTGIEHARVYGEIQ